LKARKFKIKIESAEQYWSDVKRVWKAAESGYPPSADGYDLVLSAPDLTWLSKIFSPERMRLIQVVRKQKPKSILELAKILDRAQSNVQRDISELVELGILNLAAGEGQKGETRQPRFEWDGFDIAI
jgi:predicted transcriptional regulator